MQNTPFYIILMLVAGLGIPTMASLNAMLGNRLNNTFLAVVILLSIALLVALILLLSTKGMPVMASTTKAPWYLYLGGVLFILYISSVTWVIPKFGVANSIGCVLFGQLIAMTLLDHYGAFGLAKYEISYMRITGLILMAIGIFIVVNDSTKA